MKIMWFCIPAFGHTNPTVEVVRELTARGHNIRYYSFEQFRDKIEDTGAVFIPCDSYLPPLSEESQRRIRRVSTTEMSIQAFETTARMDEMLGKDVQSFRPDLIVTDSVCFWGKLTAQKYDIPMICSTTTFAFNQYSSKYMKYSARELADMVLGMPRLNKSLKKLRPFGYHVKSALDIVQNKNDTDTIVYTSKRFQPCSETFDESHYCFAGPSVRKTEPAEKDPDKPLIYISLGTVINDHPDFYRNCIEALRNEPVRVLISCGMAFDLSKLGQLPDHIQAEPYVDQMKVLSETSLFVTHCGMNSASEGLYMGVPEVLFPLSGEQNAVARRVQEMGAGVLLEAGDAKDPQKIREVILRALMDPVLRENAGIMREDFLSCGGASAAADFIEQKGAGK